MTNLQRIKILCRETLRVCVFYLLLLWWGFQLSPMIDELFVKVPFVIFALVMLFLSLFLCRETGCLIFMPKTRLPAILRNGEIEPTASQMFLRLFSWPFLKRICMYLGLFVLEFYMRLFSIKLFLTAIQSSLSFWEKVTELSEGLLYVLIFLAAYVIMELPSWLLFYKLSFKGRSNRSYEYRFGMKLSVLVALIIGLRLLTLSLSANASSSAVDFFADAAFAVLSFGLWFLMYRKKCCCAAGGCPICNAVKGLFRKKQKEEIPVEILTKENE